MLQGYKDGSTYLVGFLREVRHYGKRKIYPYRCLKHFYFRDSEKGRRPGSLLAHRACIHWGELKDHPSKNILASLCASHLCCTQVLNSPRRSCPARFTPDCSLNFQHPSPALPPSLPPILPLVHNKIEGRNSNAPTPKTLRCSASRDYILRRKFKDKCKNTRVWRIRAQ